MRYEGQAFELNVSVPNEKLNQSNISHLPESFESEHESTYGHRYPGDKTVQIVNLRVTGTLVPKYNRNIDVNKIFSPEHGFKGDFDVGALIKDGKFRNTIDLISLYG